MRLPKWNWHGPRRAMLSVAAGAAIVAAFGAGTAAADPVTLTFTTALDPQEIGPYKAAIDAWNSAHPDIQVVHKNTPWDNYWQEKQVQSASGRMPDVWDIVPGFGAQWIYGEQLASIDEYVKADPNINLDDANATMRKYLTTATGLHGLPYDFNGEPLYYNKDLFDKAGVSYPTDSWSMDDMRNAAITISEKLSTPNQKVWGIGGLNVTWNMDGWYRAFGATLVDDQGKFGANNDAGRAAIQWIVDLIKAGAMPVPEKDGHGQQITSFISGRAAMVSGTGDFVAVFDDSDIKDHYGIVRFPKGPGGQGGVGLGGAYVISKTTEHPKEAYEFLAYMTSSDTLKKIISGGLPARKSAWTILSPHMTDFANAIDGNPPLNAVKGSLQLFDIESNVLQTVWNQSVDVKTGLQQIADQSAAVLGTP